MSAKLKVALLGAGGRGRSVLRNWVKITGCEVTAIVDPSTASIEATRKLLGDSVKNAADVTDVNSWYASADADMVLINSWDPQHAENCIACFEAGLNVMVAKPMAQSTEQADDVYRAWKKSGCMGVVDMQIRTASVTEKAMSLIAEGAIGKVRLIQCFDYVGRSGVEFRHTRSRRRDMIRSWTLAKGVHFLDLVNMFAASDPTRVFASGGRDVFGGDKPNDLHCNECDERDTCRYEGSKTVIGGIPFPNPKAGCVFAKEMDVNDNTVATIDYANGVRASYVECYFTPEYQTTYEIIGDRGAMFVRYAMDNRLWLEVRPLGTAERRRWDFYPAEEDGGAHGGGDVRIIKRVAAALQNPGTHPTPDIRDGRQAVALCEAIDTSVDTGQIVMVPPLPKVTAHAAANASA